MDLYDNLKSFSQVSYREIYKRFKIKITVNGLRTYMNTKHYRFTDIKIKKPKRNWNQRKKDVLLTKRF